MHLYLVIFILFHALEYISNFSFTLLGIGFYALDIVLFNDANNDYFVRWFDTFYIDGDVSENFDNDKTDSALYGLFFLLHIRK